MITTYFAATPKNGAAAIREYANMPRKTALLYATRNPILFATPAKGIDINTVTNAEIALENIEKDSLPPSITKYKMITVLLSRNHSEIHPVIAEHVANLRYFLRSQAEKFSAKSFFSITLLQQFIGCFEHFRTDITIGNSIAGTCFISAVTVIMRHTDITDFPLSQSGNKSHGIF